METSNVINYRKILSIFSLVMVLIYSGKFFYSNVIKPEIVITNFCDSLSLNYSEKDVTLLAQKSGLNVRELPKSKIKPILKENGEIQLLPVTESSVGYRKLSITSLRGGPFPPICFIKIDQNKIVSIDLDKSI